jgi:rhamnose transport system permease protein
MRLKAHRREISVALAIAALAVVLAITAPNYFALENLTGLFLANIPVLFVAFGMTMIILTGQIDISVGSTFAICSVAAGLLAKSGLSVPSMTMAACLIGAAIGCINGAFVAFVRIPSIVVTLASMVALRDGLRWQTQGSWVQDLPSSFQWMGFTQHTYPFAALSLGLACAVLLGWGLRNTGAGRAVYATGSNAEGARLAGIDTRGVTFSVLILTGLLTGFAAVLNSVRFNQIPSNSGIGLEMKVIAAVVVGGTSITGGVGTIAGTVLGVVLLGAIGPALTFMGVSAYWERAIQGGIILTAVVIDAVRAHSGRHATIAASRA